MPTGRGDEEFRGDHDYFPPREVPSKVGTREALERLKQDLFEDKKEQVSGGDEFCSDLMRRWKDLRARFSDLAPEGPRETDANALPSSRHTHFQEELAAPKQPKTKSATATTPSRHGQQTTRSSSRSRRASADKAVLAASKASVRRAKDRDAVLAAMFGAKVHCSTGCGTQRLKAAEKIWVSEKGKLVRDKRSMEKGARQLERQLALATSMLEMRTDEVLQLRRALRERDSRLLELQRRVDALEDYHNLVKERNQLAELLHSSLEILERLDMSTQQSERYHRAMEDKVHAMAKAYGNSHMSDSRNAGGEGDAGASGSRQFDDLEWSKKVLDMLSELTAARESSRARPHTADDSEYARDWPSEGVGRTFTSG
eukprot:jgi/Mesvir1/3487/Mv11978-RA.1